jgi:hypothetical protein
MKGHLIFVVYLMVSLGTAQTEEGKVTPKITTLFIEEGTTTVLHLGPGYATAVRLPEEISSVVIGNPASYKAEHSETEPRLLFLKPITAQPSESNALITTKSGQEISLHLINGGKGSADSRIDFLVEFQRPQSLTVSSERQSFLIADTRSVSLALPGDAFRAQPEKSDLIARELEKQRYVSSPTWQGKEVLAALGESIQRNHQTVLGFSVLNRSQRIIELLPPQIELRGAAHGIGGSRIKAEPIAVAEYRMTTRLLAPGQRADGVVVFERPALKESVEKLQLQLAQADQVDRPILLPVPFTATGQEGGQ